MPLTLDDPRKRRTALEGLSRRVEQKDRFLLSRDLDGERPFLDPREVLTVEWAVRAALRVGDTTEYVQIRYEELASQFRLNLGWK
jgi:hypothetical protein